MFPFADPIQLTPDLSVKADDVLKHVWPQLTLPRQAKISEVVGKRCYSNVVVLEDIYDRGNASAVMRSAEAFGLGQVHMIELGEKFKESQRTTAGADKWVEVKKWKSTKDCVTELKRQGKQIIVTHLDETAKPLTEIDFSKPSALVLGNEKTGVSPEMLAMADHRVIVPMIGFVQSFNISVAGALCFYQMYLSRTAGKGLSELTLDEQNTLKAIYTLRTLDSGEEILKTLALRGQIG